MPTLLKITRLLEITRTDSRTLYIERNGILILFFICFVMSLSINLNGGIFDHDEISIYIYLLPVLIFSTMANIILMIKDKDWFWRSFVFFSLSYNLLVLFSFMAPW